MVKFVESETKATRKGAGRPKKQLHDIDEFVVPESDDDGAPKTPRKRRKLDDATTPTTNRKSPATRKFLTPTHKRIVIKKQLEFTPLGTRVLSPSATASPFQLARTQLHVSSVPTALPCREEEFSTVYSHLEAAITAGSGSCIYISGTPGTGKTATVREVVAQLHASVQAEELDDFIFVEINGMKVTDPHQSYSLLWQALRGDRVSPSHALELLEREFSTPSPRRVPCVVLMDELDQLVTKNQSVMYNFFNWPGLRHSRLIVLAVANTMDLPERTLSNKISSRLGMYRHRNPLTTPHYGWNGDWHIARISPHLFSNLMRAQTLITATTVEIAVLNKANTQYRSYTNYISGLHARPIDTNPPVPARGCAGYSGAPRSCSVCGAKSRRC